MLTFDELDPLLGDRSRTDAPCPQCSPWRKVFNRKRPVLRLWRMTDHLISYHCVHCEESGVAFDGDASSLRSPDASIMRAVRAKAEDDDVRRRIAHARAVWKATLPATGTWVEAYVEGRGLRLPQGHERVLRFHPRCHFPDHGNLLGGHQPAMIAAFTRIDGSDPLPVGVHRIRGRGHDNKFMLGPVSGAAVMLSPLSAVKDELHICEGVETALKLANDGVDPIWAMGSDMGIARLPVLDGVERLVVWADNDHAGRAAAQKVTERWLAAGRLVDASWPKVWGKDWADA